MIGSKGRTVKTLTVILGVSDDAVTTTFYEPDTGRSSQIVSPYSPDEHPEFNDKVGDILYSWINKYVEKHATDGE